MDRTRGFCCYHAGDASVVRRAENDYDLPVLGFKNGIPLVAKPKGAKTVVVQTDANTGKKFVVVQGKRVEVKEVMKVKKKADKGTVIYMNRQVQPPPLTLLRSLRSPRTCTVETSTRDLLQSRHVGVQTEKHCESRGNCSDRIYQEVEEPRIVANPLIVREDVSLGQGPRCPTPILTRPCEPIRLSPQMDRKPRPALRANSGQSLPKEQILRDFEECENFDTSGNMPIHCAVIDNNLNMVKRQCVALHFKGVSINCCNYNNLTPLQLAVFNEVDKDIFEVLMKYHSDPSVLDSEGSNVIHLTVLHSSEFVLEILLRFVDLSTLHFFNHEGLTPLMICCCNNKVRMAEMLLERGVDTNARDQKSGRTALFHAVETNDVEMVKLLLSHGADPKVKNFVGMSPHEAVFEIENVDKRIGLSILGKDHLTQTKGRLKRKTSTESEGQDKNKLVKFQTERRYQKCYLKNKVQTSISSS